MFKMKVADMRGLVTFATVTLSIAVVTAANASDFMI